MSDLQLALATWLVTYLAHSTVLLLLAWTIDRLGLLRLPALREQLWRAALVGALATATLQSAGWVKQGPLASLLAFPETNGTESGATAAAGRTPDARSTPASSQLAAAETAAPPAEPVGLALVAPPVPNAALSTLRPLPEAARADGGDLLRDGLRALVGFWLAGAAFLILRTATLGWRARRELADRRPADSSLDRELTTLCDAQEVRRPVLSIASTLPGPVSLPNGEIVLPPWIAQTLDGRRRRALLAHELAHQVRRDPQWLAAALVLDSLLWLQPLHRLARRRLTALAELQADAWAARAVADPKALAECLAACAERLAAHPIARFSTALFAGRSTDSPLVERVERLMKGTVMRDPSRLWPMRLAVVLILVAGTFLLPGCGPAGLRIFEGSNSTHISVSDDGDTSVEVSRSGYSMQMESAGKVTFADDESDVAALTPGGKFELSEKLDGVKHGYKVRSGPGGELARTYSRDGEQQPLDDAGRKWLAEALPRMFRESGLDAEARVARLLAKGGPELVLAEVDLARGDYAKASYFGILLGGTRLDAPTTERALASIGKIDSDYELHRALELALTTQSLDGALLTRLIQTADKIESDYDRAELMIVAVDHLSEDAGSAARAAWLATTLKLGSAYDLGRTLQAGVAHGGNADFLAAVLNGGAARIDSDYDLRSLLESVAGRADEPVVAAAYLQATRKLGSDFDRRTALLALLERAHLDVASLRAALDSAAELGSDFEKRTVLEALAGSVAADAELSRRYREVARGLGEYERGQALRALDDAARI